MRDCIFVSYSHADHEIVNELRKQLQSAGGPAKLAIWDDTRISPSEKWRGEIAEALSTSAAVVLLLSPSFFASAFIREHELPVLMGSAERGELKVFPVIVADCEHERVTAIYQAVHDPARPLAVCDEAERRQVWDRLLAGLRAVGEEITDETHIAAEAIRLGNDVAMVPTVIAVNDKIARAKVDPAFVENETMRENTLVFLEGQRCQAISTWLLEQSKRGDLPPYRSKAIVRMMTEVAALEERALKRATELTQQFADNALAMLKAAKDHGASGSS